MGVHSPWGVVSLDTRGLTGRIYVGDHLTLLHAKYICHGPHGFGEDFLSFSHYKSMRATYGHGSYLDLRTKAVCTYFQSPFNTRLHIKFEEIWPRGFRAEVVQRCERTDGWTDGWMDIPTIRV